MATDDRGPQVAAVAILFLALAWTFVALRVYVRGIMMKSFGLDDWLALAALFLFSLYCSFVLLGVKYGTGQHLVNIPAENIPLALKWWWCCELTYVTGTAVLKASICVFLSRICVKKSEKIVIWTVLAVVIVFHTFYFFLVVFQCNPPIFFWTQYLGATKGSCLDTMVIVKASWAHAAVSAAADWTLGILPIFIVWNLVMSPRTKVSVGLILALGAIGSTATIVRIPYIKQLALPDFLYNTSDVAIWSTVEPGIGITASAMATLRPLFRSFLARSKLFGGSASGKGLSSNTGDWNPGSNRPTRAKYFRSYSQNRGANGDLEEMDLRTDIGKHGTGVTTVIRSSSGNTDEESGKGVKTKVVRTTSSEDPLKDDSSEEYLPMQGNAWDITKTTVFTTQDNKEFSGLGR